MKVRHSKKLNGRNWNMLNKVLCGVKKQNLLGSDIYFLTLTSSNQFKDLTEEEKLFLVQNDFRVLKQRFENDFSKYEDKKDGKIKYGYKFDYEVVEDGKIKYIDRGKCVEKKKFGDYFSVRTNEGYGVLHVLYQKNELSRFGNPADFNNPVRDHWIVRNWNEIHGSHIVYNKKVGKDSFKASHYVISHYVAGQKGLIRYGYSRNWLWDGFSQTYETTRNLCRSEQVKRLQVSDDIWISYKPVDPVMFRESLLNEVHRMYGDKGVKRPETLSLKEKMKRIAQSMGDYGGYNDFYVN